MYQKALECASACINLAKQNVNKELILDQYPEIISPIYNKLRIPERFSLAKNKGPKFSLLDWLKSKKRRNNATSSNEPELTDISHPNSAMNSQGESREPTENSGDDIKRKSGDPFMRNGAKYVCNYCNNDFFTKVEVMKCWDAHP